MRKLVALDKDYTIKLKSDICAGIAPDLIFLPIDTASINLKLNQKINMGEQISSERVSPVSGTVKGLKYCTINGGVKKKCLVIENDLEEKRLKPVSSRKKLTNLTQQEFISKIKNNTLRQKFQKPFTEVIISGIDDEPYVANEAFMQKKYAREILELLEAIRVLFQVKVTLALKTTDSDVIDSYANYWGTYNDIELKMVDDLYLIGQEEFLTKTLNIAKDHLYLTTTMVYELWVNIKKNRAVLEQLITISGNAIENPQVLLVKIGSSIPWIITNFLTFKSPDYDIYLNGMMQGKLVSDIQNYIVDESLNSLIFMQKDKQKSQNCCSCGACIEICPKHLNPMQAYKKNQKLKCLNCGLCTYICPAYINLRKYIDGDDDE